MAYEFKPLTADVASAASAVVRRSIVECCGDDHAGRPEVIETWTANKTPDNFRQWLSAPQAAVGAWHRGELVAVALVNDASLLLCYAVPEALHQGVGQRLLWAAEEGARAAGVKEIRLDSTRTALHFYLRNGYACAGEPQHWAGLTAHPMCKRLAPRHDD